ncbi:hypothetical protein BEWA_036590 [Theileria equi strain WA]|uniref:Uncharacterized protein n=1 Tax=Theileria equi strain WA TaxID=1537102 RepID=L1LEL8_THEEQ|nr:hypothetical protein BEWA_036590 [Theileria equi strain WA]EKX73623.1 hypothetical protein BEWA_036590 [Theileria equi strain WA]|eukprot:XP_004833075.1 hypothetical protein BEWA_036590 [Theileria equi strain WA]
MAQAGEARGNEEPELVKAPVVSNRVAAETKGKLSGKYNEPVSAPRIANCQSYQECTEPTQLSSQVQEAAGESGLGQPGGVGSGITSPSIKVPSGDTDETQNPGTTTADHTTSEESQTAVDTTASQTNLSHTPGGSNGLPGPPGGGSTAASGDTIEDTPQAAGSQGPESGGRAAVLSPGLLGPNGTGSEEKGGGDEGDLVKDAKKESEVNSPSSSGLATKNQGGGTPSKEAKTAALARSSVSTLGPPDPDTPPTATGSSGLSATTQDAAQSGDGNGGQAGRDGLTGKVDEDTEPPKEGGYEALTSLLQLLKGQPPKHSLRHSIPVTYSFIHTMHNLQ